MRRATYLIPLAIMAALIALLAQGLWRSEGPAYRPSVMVGQKAPPLALQAMAAQTQSVRLGGENESVVAINFFASWCVPCRAEHPALKRLAETKGLRLVGIAYKDKPEDVRAFLGELGDPFAEIGLDPQGKAAIAFGITGVPETFFVDRHGVIRHHVAGPLSESAVAGEIATMLAALK